jgi:type 1 fimbriae regulatory protein FimB
MIKKRCRLERTREHLRPEEVKRLLDASRKPEVSRNPKRDYCLSLLMFRHGLRVSEACRIRVSDVDLIEKEIHIRRLKRGKGGTQPLHTGEPRALKEWLSARSAMKPGGTDVLFISEQRRPLSRSTVWLLVRKCAQAAGLAELAIHPHMLRHSTGYDLANRGADTRLIQAYLGHRNIQHTVRYTELAPHRFKNLF